MTWGCEAFTLPFPLFHRFTFSTGSALTALLRIITKLLSFHRISSVWSPDVKYWYFPFPWILWYSSMLRFSWKNNTSETFHSVFDKQVLSLPSWFQRGFDYRQHESRTLYPEILFGSWQMQKLNIPSDCNWTWTLNHLVVRRTLKHLAKWLSVCLRTKWFRFRVHLQSLNLHISRQFRARSYLTFRPL